MLRPAYPIETARLLLRPMRLTDADEIYAYRSREDVHRYLPFAPRTLSGLEEWIASSDSELTEEGQALALAVTRRDDGKIVGDVVLFWRSIEHRGGELGYVFDPEHYGNGYATEAGAAMLRLGFDKLGLHRVIGRIDARNIASARVLEKLGMRREAHFVQNEFLKGEWTDEVVYAALASEWRDPTAM